MKVSKNIFREYDIRGIANKDLPNSFVELLGQVWGKYLLKNKIKKVVVGYDNRLSSPRIKKALIKGLLSSGQEVIDIGLVVTPAFYFVLARKKNCGGVMITASHNPSEFNGFKLCKKGHATIYGEEIQKIYRLMTKIRKPKNRKTEEPKDAKTKRRKNQKTETLINYNPRPEYLDYLKKKIKLNRKLKVVVDCGNGTGSLFAPKVFRSWGCQVMTSYCKSDGRFPHHIPNPQEEESLRPLISKVKKYKADLGIAIDGDADRAGAVDEKGNIIWGDQLMILYSREILKKKPHSKVITEVKCSQALIDDIKKNKGRPIIWKAGHSLIKAKMEKERAPLAGELSGHFYFVDEYYGFDDALYAAGRLLRILAGSKKKFSQLLSDVPKFYSTPEYRLSCPDNKKFEIVKKITADFRKKYKILGIDGVRVNFRNGWGLVRASNTQPALSVRVEARTAESLREYKKIIFDKLGEFKEIKT